jgi:trk system potassium uptake protein
MHILIVGAGEIGKHLAVSLSQESHSIVVIESDETVASDLQALIDARVMIEDGTSITTLSEAGAGHCDLFLAVTSDNNTNLVSSSLAAALGAKKVIARVHPGMQREEWLFDYRSHFGIDYIFSSERLAAIELSKFIRTSEAHLVEDFALGRIELIQLTVSARSEAAHHSLAQLKLPQRVRVARVHRDGASFVPSATDVLAPGDLLTIFGEPSRLESVIRKVGNRTAEEAPPNVVIFGGGEYGAALAEMLAAGRCKVRILESSQLVCDTLAQRLPKVTVIHADATSLALLKEEQIGDADFFVATTSSDEDNVMTCLQAHSIGTRQCLTLVHRADYADAISAAGTQLGIRAAVSPREAARRELLRFVTSDRSHVLKKLEYGSLVEVSVRPKSKLAGRKVHEVDWPPGSILVGQIQGIHAHVPAADDEIKVGDNLFAVVDHKAEKAFFKLVR